MRHPHWILLACLALALTACSEETASTTPGTDMTLDMGADSEMLEDAGVDIGSDANDAGADEPDGVEDEEDEPEVLPELPREDPTLDGLTPVPERPTQRTGDPDAGWDYLRYGEFIGSGIPYDTFVMFFGVDDRNLLMREGDNAVIPPSFNAFDAPNGARVVGGVTCFSCHANFLQGQYYPGMGNSFADLTRDQGSVSLVSSLVRGTYGEDSIEFEASEVFVRGASAIGSNALTPFRGVNSAFRYEESVAGHRDPQDLSWREEAYFEPMGGLLASDTPPLWNLKKKNSLYYNGMGRGDMARMIQQVMIVALTDLEQAERVNDNAGDILAWIFAQEPPAYPGEIDMDSAARGEEVFAQNCASCHGTYGEEETYPNLLVPLEMVGTDDSYARYYVDQYAMVNWYNQSWFAQDSKMVPKLGYIAPPLDGVWATAPYLHNASIPNLEVLLNSELRPTRWRRDFTSSAYNMDSLGWPFGAVDENEEADVNVYDTTLEGYGNQGHTFGDGLSDDERADLINYLKTL